MFMRYEWGLAVGHTYAYQDATAANTRVRRTHASAEHGTPTHPEQVLSGEELTSSAPGDKIADIGLHLGGHDGVDDEGEEDEEDPEDVHDGEDDDHEDSDLRGVHDPGYDSEADKEYALFGNNRFAEY